jgi:hypothetical protein
MADELNSRFKIDFSWKPRYPFALFWKRRAFFRWKWVEIAHSDNRDDCLKLYEKIKDLPQYL